MLLRARPTGRLAPPHGGYTVKKKDEIVRLADGRNVKIIAECLAGELINAAQVSSNWSTANSFSEAASDKQKQIQKKNEFQSKIRATCSKIN